MPHWNLVETYVKRNLFSSTNSSVGCERVSDEDRYSLADVSEADVKYVLDNIGANPAAFEKLGALMAGDGIRIQ